MSSWISASLALALARSAAAVTAPSGSFTSALGVAQDAGFGQFISDAGAGGFINGQHLMSISDGATVGSDNKIRFPSCHTGYAVLDPENPTNITMIADYQGTPDFWHGTPNQSGTGGGVINVMPKYDIDCGTNAACFGPAPHVAPIPIPGNSTGALNIWPVHPNEGDYVYNTMFEMNVQPASTLNQQGHNIPAVRTVPVLFNVTKGETGYGSRALTSGQGQDASKHFYAWEGDNTGLKLARAPWATRTDKTTWSYWNGAGNGGWKQNAPLKYNADQFGNIVNQTNRNYFFGVDVRYVDRFQTYVLTYSGGPGYSLYLRYSTSGAITGPYSDEVAVFQPPLAKECNNGPLASQCTIKLTDFVQMHWDYYGLNANKTLVSWISCSCFTTFGVVQWK